MSYQGILKKADGTLVDDGSYNLTFKLYDVSSGGTSLWTETQSVSVSGGLVNVILGSTTSLDLPFDKQYWLGIKVGSASELTPRIKLASSPYSLNSKAGLTLPYSGITTSDSDAFKIITSGSGLAGLFSSTNETSTSSALMVLSKSSMTAISAGNSGSGSAGFFSLQNINNDNNALIGTTNGKGVGVSGSTSGTGYAGFFSTYNSTTVVSGLD